MKAEKTEKSKYNYDEVIKQGFADFGWTPGTIPPHLT
jgi:hypothetical protein